MKKMFVLLFAMLTACVLSATYAQSDAAEQMPQFPGGDKALFEFVAQNMVYPQEAFNARIEGSVFVEFIINTDGKAVDAKILRSLTPECDAEVLRIVSILPLWQPATKDGKPIATRFVLPVQFKLS